MAESNANMWSQEKREEMKKAREKTARKRSDDDEEPEPVNQQSGAQLGGSLC